MTMLKPPVRPGVQSPLETPQLSPRGYVEQIVGVMNVSVSYSRTGMRGRKIFGGLVPFGQIWRAGANEPTTLTLSDRAKLEGYDIPAGSYSLYTIPGEQEWTIIINKKIAGFGQHDDKEDLFSFKVKPSRTSTPIETFTITFSDVSMNSANLELAWENTSVKFRVEFDVDSKVMPAIQKAMENPLADVAGTYHQSASYYFTAKKDMRVALDWVNKSLEINKNLYFVWRLKSQIQAELKDYKGAVTTAEIAGQKAKEAGNHPVAKLIEGTIAEWTKMIRG